jgi:hypothetical protein
MLLFRRMLSLQKFAFLHALICNLCNGERSVTSRSHFKLTRADALAEWRRICRNNPLPFLFHEPTGKRTMDREGRRSTGLQQTGQTRHRFRVLHKAAWVRFLTPILE